MAEGRGPRSVCCYEGNISTTTPLKPLLQGWGARVLAPDWTVAVGGTKNVALFDVIVNYMLFLRCRWCSIKDLHIVQGGARVLTLSSSCPHRQSRWC